MKKISKGKLILKDEEVEGFLERVVTQKYLNRRVYVVVTKKIVKK